MTTMQSEVYEAFRSLDISEDKAMRAATALAKRDDEVSSLKGEMLVIKWMVAYLVALETAMALHQFMH